MVKNNAKSIKGSAMESYCNRNRSTIGSQRDLEEKRISYRPLAARRSRNETTAESSVLVNVRVSSKDRRKDSLSAKPICLRQDRISTARRYKISSFEVR